METSLDWFIYFINFNFIEMVIFICVLGVLLCFSFAFNLYHFTEFRCYKNYQKILKKYLDYAGYKHLDIKWTKKEKQILKNLENEHN
jgi:hypothetical protein